MSHGPTRTPRPVLLAALVTVGSSGGALAAQGDDPPAVDPVRIARADTLLRAALEKGGRSALAFATRMCDRIGPRPLGSPACAEAAAAVSEALSAAGLVVEGRERSVEETWRRHGASLVLAGTQRALAVRAAPWSAATDGPVEVEIRAGAPAADGAATFTVRRLDAEGAVAPLSMRSAWTPGLSWSMPWPADVPVVGARACEVMVAFEDASLLSRLLAQADGGALQATLDVRCERVPATTPVDVCALLRPGEGGERLEGSIVVLAPLDGTDVGPSAHGAASVALLVETARLLAGLEGGLRRPVRFVFAAGLSTEHTPTGSESPAAATEAERAAWRAGPAGARLAWFVDARALLVVESRPGAGAVSGVALEGAREWLAPMERAFAPLAGTPFQVYDVGLRTEPGAHRLLRRYGVPAFAVMQSPTVGRGVRDSAVDTPDKLGAEDFAQAVAALAVAIEGLADDPGLPVR